MDREADPMVMTSDEMCGGRLRRIMSSERVPDTERSSNVFTLLHTDRNADVNFFFFSKKVVMLSLIEADYSVQLPRTGLLLSLHNAIAPHKRTRKVNLKLSIKAWALSNSPKVGQPRVPAVVPSEKSTSVSVDYGGSGYSIKINHKSSANWLIPIS